MDKKSVFIITPLGDKNSKIREDAEDIIAEVEKCVTELGYSLHLPNENQAGSIMTHIIEHIIMDDLIIANITGLNPNVMYELGICHCLKKPTICIKEKSEIFPFDIKDDRIVEFTNSMRGAKEFHDQLKSIIISTEKLKTIRNPYSIACTLLNSEKEVADLSKKEHDNPQYNVFVKKLILEVDYESREKINGRELIGSITKIYNNLGYTPGSILWQQQSGKIEIEKGMRTEVMKPLVKELIFQFGINHLSVTKS